MFIKNNLTFLMDGNSYIYKFYYASIKTNNINKIKSSAIYGILYTIKKILLVYRPKKLIVIFDSPTQNFRKKIFKEYKKKRPCMPKNLAYQIPIIYKILYKIGIPVLIIPNVEADDVIGSISKIAEKYGDKVLIGTSDKDLMQLVNKNIQVLNNINNVIFTKKHVKKKYGVKPKLITDLLSLIGDPCDNIPGVLGVGKKTAIFLISKIGPIKSIYNNFKKIKMLFFKKKKMLNNLIYGKKMAFLSYKLLTLKTNLPLIKKYKKLNFNPKNNIHTKKFIKYFHIIYEIKNIIRINQNL